VSAICELLQVISRQKWQILSYLYVEKSETSSRLASSTTWKNSSIMRSISQNVSCWGRIAICSRWKWKLWGNSVKTDWREENSTYVSRRMPRQLRVKTLRTRRSLVNKYEVQPRPEAANLVSFFFQHSPIRGTNLVT